MTGFRVTTGDLDSAATRLTNLGYDGHRACQYVNANLRIPPANANGILVKLLPAVETMRSNLDRTLQDVSSFAVDSGAGVHAAAVLYQQTDAAEAARLDATYPDPQRSSSWNPEGFDTDTRPSPDQSGYDDWRDYTRDHRVDDGPADPATIGAPGSPPPPIAPLSARLPSSFLDSPYPTQVIPEGISLLAHWTDLFSISHDALWIIQTLTGWNPVETLAEGIAGDWRTYGVAEEATRQVREYAGALALMIHEVSSRLDQAWDGQAGDAAVAFFTTAATRIGGLRHPLEECAVKMRGVSLAISNGASLLVGIFEALLDAAIVMAIEAAAGAALSETVIGALVMWGLAAAEAAVIVSLVSDALNGWSLLMNGVDLAVALLAGAAGHLTVDGLGFSTPAYQHPGLP